MTQNYTSFDLIRYIYGETSVDESVAIRSQIELQENFKNEYLTLLKGYSKLTAVQFSPSIVAENFILNSSKNFHSTAK